MNRFDAGDVEYVRRNDAAALERRCLLLAGVPQAGHGVLYQVRAATLERLDGGMAIVWADGEAEPARVDRARVVGLAFAFGSEVWWRKEVGRSLTGTADPSAGHGVAYGAVRSQGDHEFEVAEGEGPAGTNATGATVVYVHVDRVEFVRRP